MLQGFPRFSGRKSVFCLTGVLVLASTMIRADGGEAGLRARVDAAITQVKPALVRIEVVSAEYQEGREIKQRVVGSGAIISEDGYLITNHHVAGRGQRMICTLSNREEIPAELIGTDPLTDLSILKLKPASPRQFSIARFGDSSRLRVGDYVLAMGSPMALSQSVTLGIVSNTEMIMPRFFGPAGRLRLDGEDVGALVRWIGHDAAIYGGNSGGPLVNLAGEIVGINELSLGLGGAIPGNLASEVARQIIASGRVVRSWLGLGVQPRLKHAAADRGVLISGVIQGSPAEQAGIRPGDLLVSLAGEEVDVRYDEQMPDFMRLTTSLPIGQPVSARLLRAGQPMAVTLEPRERGELYARQQELKAWGLTARNLTYLSMKELKRSSQDGVVITSVRPGGPGGEAKPPLERGDVLVEVNGKAIRDLTGLLEQTRGLSGGERVPVIVVFERKAARYLSVVKVGSDELRDPGLEVTKAWLPIEVQVISRDLARQLEQPDLKGFYITQVHSASTAETTGLKPGDFITAVDGQKLMAAGPEHADELNTLIRQYDLGGQVTLQVRRGTVATNIPVELVRSPRLQREMKKYHNADFEFLARDVSFVDAVREQWPENQPGVLVEEVKSGSWAELGALYVNDLILEVDGGKIDGVETLRGRFEELTRERRPVTVLKVLRGIHTRFLELEADWND
jgi:serine protease Do